MIAPQKDVFVKKVTKIKPFKQVFLDRKACPRYNQGIENTPPDASASAVDIIHLFQMAPARAIWIMGQTNGENKAAATALFFCNSILAGTGRSLRIMINKKGRHFNHKNGNALWKRCRLLFDYAKPMSKLTK